MDKRQPALIPWAAVILLWGGAFALACRIDSVKPDAPRSDSNIPVAAALVGETRTGLSSFFYRTADVYFHKGGQYYRPKAFTNDVFQRLTRIVSPAAHAHRHGQETGEIMPWLRLALKADPNNVEVYLNAAFFLAYRLDRPDLAATVLGDAQFQCPGSYRIRTAQARLWLQQGQREAARSALDSGLRLWPGLQAADSEDARLGRAQLQLYSALLYEAKGELEDAVAALEDILAVFPERAGLQRRLAQLQRGETPDVPALQHLQRTLTQHEGHDEDELCAEPCDAHDHDHH